MLVDTATLPDSRIADLSDLARAVPAACLLGSDRLSAVVTAAGTGAVVFDGADLTRFRADRVTDADGLFVYLRDADSGRVWSAGRQPTGAEPDDYRARLGSGTVCVERLDDGLRTTTEWTASGGALLARVRVENLAEEGGANTTDRARRVELTTYGEVALNARAGDAGHPAFSKLFVETEAAGGVLLAHRRPRTPEDAPLWLAHWAEGGEDGGFETDRMRFVGRGRDVRAPQAVEADLSGTTGAVLDPCVAIRRTLTLAPGETATVTLGLGGARSRGEALGLAARLGADAVSEALSGAADADAACRERLGLDVAAAERAQALVGALVYGGPTLRAPQALLGAVTPDAVMPEGITGRGPLVVVRVRSEAGARAARALSQARRCWSDTGLETRLVVLADAPVADAEADTLSGLSDAETARLASEATVWTDDALPIPSTETLPVAGTRTRPEPSGARLDPAGLREWNGTGGFTADGTEYVIHVTPDAQGRPVLPPLPWTNVLANETAGAVVSETGATNTWAANSREHRLSPWSNDPVSDPHAEALWVQDLDAGTLWSPTGGPAFSGSPVEVRHGFGVTRWRTAVGGIEHETARFAARTAPAILTLVTLANTTDRPRRVAVTAYTHLVLGSLATGSDRQVRTRRDGGALVADNPTAGEFAARVAVASAAAPGATVSLTADRAAFLGRFGRAEAPAALLTDTPLDGRTGAGLDPCAALRAERTLQPGETARFAFVLGEADDAAGATALRDLFASPEAVEAELMTVSAFWTDLTTRVQITTPEPALDLLVNGWLVVQNLACRIWGRSAFYQSGGAYGFRDQLQDSLAFAITDPAVPRAQILRNAAHQFPEGDVLHWWHPPLSKGMRTRFADDLLWLPLLASHYVDATGDVGVWDERTPFVDAPLLEPGEDEVFLVPERPGRTATVYEHACLAIERSLAVGDHGLPLMGVGDWNDGMNRVGREGRGESVWMGMFLFDILGRVAPIAEARGETDRAARFRAHRARLETAVNADGGGWDGAWYRRAYYDNGAPLGSTQSDECQVDALAQAWAVLTGIAPPARAAQALDALEERLVDRDAGIIRLLTPAFDRTPHDPGYIKGYLPGVRENGGQYTHAALWAARAFAEAGRCETAAPLLAMLSPVAHSRTPDDVAVYQTEPYAVAADVYGVAPHVGRGGWTWYTGSAGWMWRVAIESVVGLTVEAGEALRIAPCIPAAWPGLTVRYRVPGDTETRYTITVERGAAAALTLDGEALGRSADGAARVPLARDGRPHAVVLTIAS